MTAVARVLIDSPLPQLDRLFDYAVPPELAAEAVPGARVRVPLRSAGRVVDGYLVELGEPDPDGRPLSELNRFVDEILAVTPAQVQAFAGRRWTEGALRTVVVGDFSAAPEAFDQLAKADPTALRLKASELDFGSGALLPRRP